MICYGDKNPSVDHVEIALEENCGALMMLELISARADAAGDVAAVRAEANLAIQAVRRAIDELRMMRHESMSPASLGFVVAAPSVH